MSAIASQQNIHPDTATNSGRHPWPAEYLVPLPRVFRHACEDDRNVQVANLPVEIAIDACAILFEGHFSSLNRPIFMV